MCSRLALALTSREEEGRVPSGCGWEQGLVDVLSLYDLEEESELLTAEGDPPGT